MSKKEKDEPIFDVEEAYSKTESYIEENKKSITLIVVIIFILFGGYFGYKRFYLQPREREASTEIWKAEYFFDEGSLQKAIEGDDQTYVGFKYIANQYSGTQTGNLAAYYLGVSYLNTGKYEKAIEWLEACDLDDALASAVSKGALGDAYMELNNFEKATEYYESASGISDNNFTSPIYLKKAGIAHEELGNFQEAIKKYEKIENKYPESSEAREMEKYIARAESYVKE